MTKNISKNEQVRQIISQPSVTDEGQEAMQRLRICPRKVLESLTHLRIDRTRISPIESQDPKTGGNADVEAAILTSSRPSNSSEPEVTEYVAVKKLRFDTETDDDRALAPFAHEVGLLNDLWHPNVAKIVGFVEEVDRGVAWLMFTWEKNGNLREFVRSANWELPERVSLINDVAKGLRYLHGRSPPICHGDLKSLNILVNSKNRAVITDFGSARSVKSATEAVVSGVNVGKAKIQHQTLTGVTTIEPLKAELTASGEFITMTGPAWTVRWAAPELLGGVPPDLGSDVWAFGWICWEAVTGNFPFDDDETYVAIIRRIVTSDLPTVRNNTQLNQMKTLCSLMEECLKFDTNKRPPAIRCQQALAFMDQTIPSGGRGNGLATTRSSGLLHALGRIQLRNGVTPKALEYFRQSLEASKSVGDGQGKARALNAIGEVHRMRNEYSEAEESYIQSRDLYSQIGDRLGLAQSVKALGDVYRMRNEYSKAEESYIQSRDLFSAIRNQLGLAQSVMALGELYGMRSEYSKAEESYIQSRDLYSRLRHQLGLAQSVKALGDVYRMRNEYSKAEESYIQSRDLFSGIGDQLGLAHSVNALGELYWMRSEYPKAEQSYIQSRDLYSDLGNQLGLANSLMGLGHLHSNRHEYAKAAESYSEARRIYHQIGDRYSLANISWYLGLLHCSQAQYEEAERLFREASTIYGELGLKNDVANCDNYLAEVRQLQEKSLTPGV